MANDCWNHIRIRVDPTRAAALADLLRGPRDMWAPIGSLLAPTPRVTGHDIIEAAAIATANMEEARAAYATAGRPDWMDLNAEDVLWWVEHDRDLSTHPAVRKVPLSFPRALPWRDAAEFASFGSPYDAYLARFGLSSLPLFDEPQEDGKPDFTGFDAGTDLGGVMELELTCTTRWAPPLNPVSIFRDALVSQGASAIWAWNEAGQALCGAQVLQGGEIISCPKLKYPDAPHPEDPSCNVFDPDIFCECLMEEGVDEALASDLFSEHR
jgi:hypothetical protein